MAGSTTSSSRPRLTGVPARIIVLVGKWFPTGAHKVGAAFGCLVPRLVTGQFDPTTQKAVWPSTGNYCRGGAYDSALLACKSIAILPEGMSKERFEWLSKIAGETIKTPGSESNVKEIFDKCWELRKSGQDLMIFNQFEEFGNYLWHYEVTGHAMEEVLQKVMGPNDRYRGMASATGSAGTIASGDYMKKVFPDSKIVASEALQCPTLLENGFGAHRIEGIGDKHVPWIHNSKNTDMVVAIDDNAVVNISRLFNEETGRAYLVEKGVPEAVVTQLDLLGFSGISNVLSGIKAAKYYEMGENDIMVTVLTELDGALPLPPAGDAPGVRPVQRARRRCRLCPLPAWTVDRQHARAALHRPPPCPQPEVLHLGRAAGQDLRRDPEAVVGAGLLDRCPEAGRRDRRVDRGIQPGSWTELTDEGTGTRQRFRPCFYFQSVMILISL